MAPYWYEFHRLLVVRFSCLLCFGSRKCMQLGWNKVDIITCVCKCKYLMMWTLEDTSLYLRRLFLSITSFFAQISVLGNWFIPVLCKWVLCEFQRSVEMDCALSLSCMKEIFPIKWQYFWAYNSIHMNSLIVHSIAQALTYFTLWRPRALYVAFVVDKLALWHAFLWLDWFSLARYQFINVAFPHLSSETGNSGFIWGSSIRSLSLVPIPRTESKLLLSYHSIFIQALSIVWLKKVCSGWEAESVSIIR
jgi:hypothetical protein